MAENRGTAVAEVYIPQWDQIRQYEGAVYDIPYLGHGHTLRVTFTDLGVWYILSHDDREIVGKLNSFRDWSELVSSHISDVASVVLVRKDGSVNAQADRFGFYPIYYGGMHEQGVHKSRIWFDLAQAGTFSRRPSRDFCVSFIAQLNHTFPFDTLTVWDGVSQLAPGWGAYIDCYGITLERNSQLPEARIAVGELAPRFRKSLQRHLDQLLDSTTPVSCDLSGGLDSSYSAAILANEVPSLQTVFLEDGVSNTSDHYWAESLSTHLRSKHHWLPYWENTTVFGYEDVDLRTRMPFGFDESFRYATLAPRLCLLAKEFGASLHFNGHGGDELFGPNSAMAWSYYRSSSLKYGTRLKNTLGFAKANKFPLVSFMRSVRSDRSFEDEIKSGLNVAGTADLEKFDSSWLQAVTLPSFVSNTFKEHLEDLTGRLACLYTEPYSSDRSQHRIVEDVISHVSLLRSMNLMTQETDFYFASLFLEPDVISTAMLLSIEDRFMARVLKPLLHATWPQSVPDDVFQRFDKGEYSAATFREFDSSKHYISSLFSDKPILVELDLISDRGLVESVNSFSADGTAFDNLLRVAALESWISER